MKDLLITHNDLDGISPIILMNLTKRAFEFKSIEISEISETLDDFLTTDLTQYENIYIVDLTIPKKYYEKLVTLNNCLVFDHHESHLYATKYNFTTIKVTEFSHLTCGTELFYNYLKNLYPNLDTPLIKDYVELVRQGDIWDFSEDNRAKQLGFLVHIHGKKDFIKSLTKRLTKDKEKFELTAFEKRYIKMAQQEQERYLKNKEIKMQRYEINGYKVGIVFAESHKSELGNYLSLKNPDLDLIAVIDSCEKISYRTFKDDIRTNDFAQIYGGGGHQKASGSEFSQEIKDKIIELYFKDVKRLETGKI